MYVLLIRSGRVRNTSADGFWSIKVERLAYGLSELFQVGSDELARRSTVLFRAVRQRTQLPEFGVCVRERQAICEGSW